MQPNNIVYEQRRIVLDGSDTQTDADITRKEGYRAKAQGADGLTLREKRGGDGRLAGAQRPSATPPPDNVDFVRARGKRRTGSRGAVRSVSLLAGRLSYSLCARLLTGAECRRRRL